MKLKTPINCLALLLLFVTTAAALNAQTPAQQASQDERAKADARSPYKVVIFDVKHRNADAVARALVGSGAPGTQIVPNRELKTITVRDYPENILVIGEAIKRFDQPTPDVSSVPESLEFELHLIAASQNATEKVAIPASLEKVVQQLRGTLKYANYRYLTTLASRVIDGGSIKGSGFIDPPFASNNPNLKSNYTYQLQRANIISDAAGKEAYQVRSFQFQISVPIFHLQSGQTQLQGVMIETELSLREGETAVVGTANVGGSDEAIIVVVTARKVK